MSRTVAVLLSSFVIVWPSISPAAPNRKFALEVAKVLNEAISRVSAEYVLVGGRMSKEKLLSNLKTEARAVAEEHAAADDDKKASVDLNSLYKKATLVVTSFTAGGMWHSCGLNFECYREGLKKINDSLSINRPN